MTFVEELRLEYFLRAAGDPNRPAPRPARPSGVLGALLFVKVFAIALGTVIGAGFLCAACALYNKLAGGKGSPSSVPELLLGKAMRITFVTTLFDVVAGFVIGLLIGASSAAAGPGERGPAVVAQLLSLPVSLLVMAGMNCALLPTTFTRGLLVALCYLLVVSPRSRCPRRSPRRTFLGRLPSALVAGASADATDRANCPPLGIVAPFRGCFLARLFVKQRIADNVSDQGS